MSLSVNELFSNGMADQADFRKTPSGQQDQDTVQSLKHNSAFKRAPKFPLENVPGQLPLTHLPEKIDVVSIAANCVSELESLQLNSFADGAVWRDLYVLTGLPRTFYGRDQIVPIWKEVGVHHRPQGFSMIPGTARVMSFGSEVGWVQANYKFETRGTPGTLSSGLIGVIPNQKGEWKIWLLTTILEQLKDFPSPDRFHEASTKSNTIPHSQSSDHYECVVIGAGFAGLCLSARLKALNVRYVTLERNARVGENWRNRYESATFHTGRDMSDFPLDSVFTEHDPYYLTQKDLARGYETFAQKHHLNIWTNSILKAASYDEEHKFWTLQVIRDDGQAEVKTRHFVLAIGSARTPVMPELKGRELFKGTVVHSGEYQSSEPFAGRRGVVVGTANTVHDVAEDMLRAGLGSVTMVQRGKTLLYNKNVPIEEADRAAVALPNSIIRQIFISGYNIDSAREPERYAAVEKAGFRIDRNVDIWNILCSTQGGHYIDVGTSKKIGDELIKIKNDASVVGFTESSLVFNDGSTLDANFVVFCTGFANNIRDLAVEIVEAEIGTLLDDYFSVDEEGEIRGAWKPHGQPGIWYTGGSVTIARFYSRFLALQIRADTAGTPLKIYKKKGQ